MSITESGGFRDPDGFEHGFLPDEPPASPPFTFTDTAGRTHEVDPQQCADYYAARGKTLPTSVTLGLPDGTTETHDWVGYGKRFAQIAHAVAAGQPIPPLPSTSTGPSTTTPASSSTAPPPAAPAATTPTAG